MFGFSQDLANEKIEGEPGHFSWLSQLRMYWEDAHGDPDNLTVMVRMMNAQVSMFGCC
jgi:dynein heavy chain